MTSELGILKKIGANNKQANISFLASQTGFSPDYVRCLCRYLVKKELLEIVPEKRHCYRITRQGEKEIKGRQPKNKPKVSKKKKTSPKQKHNPGEKGLTLGQIISKRIVKAVSLMINKIKGRIKEQN